VYPALERSRRWTELSDYNPGMAAKRKTKPTGPWTAEEIDRNERAKEARAQRDHEKTPEERLEETLRMSRFLSELRQGVDGPRGSVSSPARVQSTPRGLRP
jgi:hypothetical protein